MADKGGVYVLDEPTTGLLDRLVDSGKSVIVIEHDADPGRPRSA